MDQLKVSIIVPAFNAERWLEECCRSVFRQTYVNWELIVIDDGSTDKTWPLLQALAAEEPRLRPVHRENGGVSRARNLGLSLARGEYLTFLDADDLLLPHTLTTLVQALEESEAAVAVGWKTEFDHRGRELGCPYPREKAIWEGTQGLRQCLLDHPATYAVWGKLYRREFLAGLTFPEGISVQEDSFFLFQLMLRRPRVAVSDQVVLRYRLHPDSLSHTPGQRLLEIPKLARRKLELLEAQYPEMENLGRNLLVKANMALLENLAGDTSKAFRQAENRAIREIRRNARYFRSASGRNRRWFWMICVGLYRPYKWLRRGRARWKRYM